MSQSDWRIPAGRFGRILVVAAFMIALVACDRAGQREEHTLQLLCGGGLRPPVDGSGMEEEPGIIERFTQAHPEIEVEASYGASNLLLGQVKISRRGDLFFPGDDFYIGEAKKEGLVAETRTVAWFVPVIMVQRGNPLGVRNVAGLADPSVRLAVAEARAAAIGRITPEIFAKNAIAFDELENIAFTGVTAPEVAQAVELSHADAAIVWRPVAEQYTRKSVIIPIEPGKNVISPLVIAVLTTSRNREAALKFADFISGPQGREVFRKYNYDLQ